MLCNQRLQTRCQGTNCPQTHVSPAGGGLGAEIPATYPTAALKARDMNNRQPARLGSNGLETKEQGVSPEQ
jgi:hypothetical protein